ncbi:tRNA(Met) cytidine acetyltransferase [Halorubellus sp. JP-L1]|uniref:tRNA(Met) cytidine acetyltransferase TmcA n=1 Tax=Halorubellus sp. JP-L1 TaxID=2715753 RepID=UPI00140D7A4B|nr:tRNA(Met) cytidine acetyltransferase TmcA [Halorubellus sp. JP-L1]NHN40699.1 tRNA(Met) cytidine acetyltransferase [Halorubellus sp. JP-L1]
MNADDDAVDVRSVARALRAEAERANERRVLVLAGSAERTRERAHDAVDALDVGVAGTTVVGPVDFLPGEHVPQRQAGSLLGSTRDVVVLDCHEALRPNALGRVAGVVDGGGLLLVLAPPIGEWPDRRDGFDEGLAVPPFGLEDVTGHFRQRLVALARAHRGVGIVAVGDPDSEAGSDRLVSDGRTAPPPARPAADVTIPADARFPAAAYEACRTTDQADAVHALESLLDDEAAVVVEADRGRGKSSAAGLAAGSLAARGEDVVVTAAERRGSREVFERARELLDALDADGDHPGEYHLVADAARETMDDASGGSVRFASVADVVASPTDGDVLVVDEAATVPVRRLEATLDADRVAYATTVHGYEGTGRGFDVRFRGRLEDARHDVTEVRLVDPIRYAAGDPVEVWAFRALLLDARPPVDDLVADATPESVAYREFDAEELLADEHLLRETFGSLVLAHYRTEPDDLARLLDAPNLSVHALVHDGHVACVALLAREGDLPEGLRANMYEGGRVKGNMLPDVLTSQLRDEAAAATVGYRVVRIATHHAVRRGGLASHLLDRIRDAVGDDVDWLGSGFGATPGLVDFWRENGYRSVHLSTTRNDASGEYSAIVLDPTSDAGHALLERHGEWFAERVPSVLSDALDDADPDVVRATLRACPADVDVDLGPAAWRTVVGASYGPGLFDVAPAPFRDLAVKHLVDPDGTVGALTDREERLLVRRVLQARSWPTVADALEYVSPGACMRSLGDAFVPLVDAYGTDDALADRDRYRD